MLSDLERRVKILQCMCLSPSLTKIYSARATGGGGRLPRDDVIGDKSEQSRTLRSSYFVDLLCVSS